jgi:DNA-binding response OmpR family regulator
VKILLIDDEESFLELCRDFLQTDFTVFAVNTAIKAFHIMEKEDLDAIVLDWNIPGISGRHILQRIRSNPKFEFVPIVVLSGSTSFTTEKLSYQEGADEYIEKPVLPDTLRRRINKLIDEQKFSRELADRK